MTNISHDLCNNSSLISDLKSEQLVLNGGGGGGGGGGQIECT